MNLQDIFDDLAFGELSQLALGAQNSGLCSEDPQINMEDRPAIVRHINLGLTALYKRFRLAEKEVEILLVEGKSSYILNSRFASTNTRSSEPVKYLIDVNEPFNDTLLKVEDCWAWVGDCWVPVPLNETNNPRSLRTPTMFTLVVPDDFGLQAVPTKLKVKYRSNHRALNPQIAMYSAMDESIDLPSTHLPALLYYVASRVMNPVGMIEEFHSGNSYFAKYEAECQRLEGENFQIDDQVMNGNFHRQGFI